MGEMTIHHLYHAHFASLNQFEGVVPEAFNYMVHTSPTWWVIRYWARSRAEIYFSDEVMTWLDTEAQGWQMGYAMSGAGVDINMIFRQEVDRLAFILKFD